MRMRYLKLYFILSAIIYFAILGLTKPGKIQNRIAGIDYNYINSNNIKMWAGNNGILAHNPAENSSGFIIQGIDTLGLIFSDGLLIGGKIGRETRVSGITYRSGFQPGKIFEDGKADNPELEKYKVYKLNNNWQTFPNGSLKEEYEKNFYNYPAEDGAPWNDVNRDGKYEPQIDSPIIWGDEMLWFVSNDLDTALTNNFPGVLPMGLELQTKIYCLNQNISTDSALLNTIFKEYTIINKSDSVIRECIVGLWSDPDTPFLQNNNFGCDTTLNLGFCYQASLNNIYKNNYAIGYKILDSHINNSKNRINATAFTIPVAYPYWDFNYPPPVVLGGVNEHYNYLNGKRWDGTYFINPITLDSSKFLFPGDLHDTLTWTMQNDSIWRPLDVKLLLSVAIGDIAPGDTIHLSAALIAAEGESIIGSVDNLKERAKTIQNFYDHYKPSIAEYDEKEFLPDYFYLSQNYPNPFNPETTIDFELPIAENIELAVYNLLGENVKTIASGNYKPGKYKFNFNGQNLSSGVYFYRLDAGRYSMTKKMILLK